MADDPFVTWDGAYVLGALSPEDRNAYEAHLRTCPDCTRSVQWLAGLPGLLSRADLAEPEPPPEVLMPRLLRAVDRERRRRRLLTGGGWLAAAAAGVALVLVVVLGSQQPTPAPAAPSSPMVALADTPLSAQVSLVGVTWGTKLEVKCTYPEGYTDDKPYVLTVWNREGDHYDIGSWKVVPGRTATMNASTGLADTDIVKVAIHEPDGQPILVLDR